MPGESTRQAKTKAFPTWKKRAAGKNIPEKGVRLSRACLTRFKTFMSIELSLGHDV
jgi:hypothetical protein